MDPWSKREKAIIYKIIDDFYVDFVQKVADARQMNYDDIDQLGQGHVWTSEQALNNGLLDNVGGFYEALKAAKLKAGIDENVSVRLGYYPKKKSLFGNILNKVETVMSVNMNPLETLVKQLEKIQNEPMALMPYKIVW
jgi:protease-4